MGNASFCPQITDLLSEIVDDISTVVLKAGKPIVILDNYQWIAEVLSLLAKQVNLCESCILLLENGMEQEAYLLARSQFNNMLWIKYLCDGEGNERINKYIMQPYISQIKQNKNLKLMLNDFSKDLGDDFDKEKLIEQLDKSIEDNKIYLAENGFNNKVKSISELAKQNGVLFGTYVTSYNDASKFEHSDVSKTKKYRKQILNEYSNSQAFLIDISTSNKNEWLSVLHYSILSLYYSYESFCCRIMNKEKHLMKYPKNSPSYSQDELKSILIKFSTCMALLKKEKY